MSARERASASEPAGGDPRERASASEPAGGDPEDLGADVVIVGGGVLGCCVAYHLLEAGVRRVVVIDAGDLGSGTTIAGAGFVGLWAAGYEDFLGEGDLLLEHYGIDFYRRLAERDDRIDFRANGNLFLAATEEGWERYVRTIAEHPLAPADIEVLDAAAVAELTGGVVDEEGIVRGVLHPGGIQVDTGPATEALGSQVRARGGDIRTGTRVERLDIASGRMRGVRTGSGTLRAPVVVLCAGAWTNEVLDGSGWRVPLLPVVASRVINEPSGVPATMPTLMVPELSGLWVREHRGGLTYGNGHGYKPLHALRARASASEPGGGDPSDGYPARRPKFPNLVGRMRERLRGETARALPGMVDTPMASWQQGVPCDTPDRRFLVGQVPDVEGLFVVAGCNEGGVTHGPGLGRLVAELVTEGRASIADATPYRLDRFDPDEYPTPEAVAAAMSPPSISLTR